MTLTVRSATVTGATTKGDDLTHAEMDANWAHVIDSANQTFTPSGSGAVARTMQAKARELLSLDDFATAGNYATALAALGTSGQFALPGKLSLGASSLGSPAPMLYVVSLAGERGIEAVANGGGNAITAACNSGNGIAMRASNVGTTQAAFVASATGYHAADFQMITNLGDATNSEATAINAISVYGYAAFLQQGGSPGSPGSTLEIDVTRPALYVVRDIDDLDGNDFTAPIMRIEGTSNVSTTTGGIFECKWNGTAVFQVGPLGTVTFAPGGLVKSPSTVQITGQGGSVDTGAAGIELRGGTTPSLTAYNRATAANIAMIYDALSHDFQISGGSEVSISSSGVMTIGSLAGTGSRTVVADANGVLSAP